MTEIHYREDFNFTLDDVLSLYHALHWSSAEKPDQLINGLKNSHYIVTAWENSTLVGLANAISDGHLVAYISHVAVHPDYHRRGIGRGLMTRLMKRYEGFHQQGILADKNAVPFFKSLGFEQAGACHPMWIFAGDEH